MNPSGIFPRSGETGILSLGALLTIVLCGGIAVFLSLVFLMASRVRARRKESSAWPYGIPDEYSQTRLTERPVLIKELEASDLSNRISSCFSPVFPPIVPLPSLPTFNSFKFFRSPGNKHKERKRNCTSGGGIHGRQVQQYREKHRQYGVMSTGPAPALVKKKEFGVQHEHEIEPQQLCCQLSPRKKRHQKENRMEVQLPKSQLEQHYEYHSCQQRGRQYSQQHGRRQNFLPQKCYGGDNVFASQSSPNFAMQNKILRGWQSVIRVPAVAHVRPPAAGSDLSSRNILRSTDQHVRERFSQFSEKRSLPPSSIRGFAIKTPQGYCRSSLWGTGCGNTLGHINGNEGVKIALHPPVQDAAKCLTAEAAQQLKLLVAIAKPDCHQGRDPKSPNCQARSSSSPGLKQVSPNSHGAPQGSLQRTSRRTTPNDDLQWQRSVDSEVSILTLKVKVIGDAGDRRDKEIIQRHQLDRLNISQTLPINGNYPVGYGNTPCSNKVAPAVSDSIATLRGMNSVISSCSITSATSSAVVRGDIPLVSNLLGTIKSPARRNAQYNAAGNDHYFNIGKGSFKRNGSSDHVHKTKHFGHKRNRHRTTTSRNCKTPSINTVRLRHLELQPCFAGTQAPSDKYQKNARTVALAATRVGS